ncbi:MAG: hypothetical protein R3F56_18425 [Planctomycetota bacterium]
MATDLSLALRVQVLERSLRRTRSLLLLGVGAVAGLTLLAARPLQPAAEPVTATEFRLVDSKGNLRGSFCLLDDQHPSLALLDGEGHKRWEALVKNGEVYTYLRDNQGHGRITQAVDVGDHPHFLMHDKGNKPRLHAAIADSGAPSLIFIHADGTMPAGLGVHADGRGWVLPAAGAAAEDGKNGKAGQDEAAGKK